MDGSSADDVNSHAPSFGLRGDYRSVFMTIHQPISWHWREKQQIAHIEIHHAAFKNRLLTIMKVNIYCKYNLLLFDVFVNLQIMQLIIALVRF